jgi:hypothetical protein
MDRNLGKPGWDRSDTIFPRHKINNDKLVLINRPQRFEYLIHKGDYENFYESIKEYIENDSFYLRTHLYQCMNL